MNNSTAKAKPKMTVKNDVVYGDALSAQEKKRIVMQKKKDRKAKKVRKSAQQTIPYVEMCRDGICKVNSRLYTKSIAFEDINYQLAQNEDKTAIFENWCDFLNYFDSSIFVQLSFINQKASLNEFRKRINIPVQEDAFNDIRSEYSGMLQSQLTKGNNGLIKKKYITFGIEADSLRTAKPKLERIETDILNNFKTLGVRTEPLSGYERLKVLHDVFNMDSNAPFRFSFDMVARTGLSSKDFIAPTSFDFREGKCFKMGRTIGADSSENPVAPYKRVNDRACFQDLRRMKFTCSTLNPDIRAGMGNQVAQSKDQFIRQDEVCLPTFRVEDGQQHHGQFSYPETIEKCSKNTSPTKAIKSIKSKITENLDKMKIEEQKRQ